MVLFAVIGTQHYSLTDVKHDESAINDSIAQCEPTPGLHLTARVILGSQAKGVVIYDNIKGPYLSGAFLQQLQEYIDVFSEDMEEDPDLYEPYHENICFDLDVDPLSVTPLEAVRQALSLSSFDVRGPWVIWQDLRIHVFLCRISVAVSTHSVRITLDSILACALPK